MRNIHYLDQIRDDIKQEAIYFPMAACILFTGHLVSLHQPIKLKQDEYFWSSSFLGFFFRWGQEVEGRHGGPHKNTTYKLRISLSSHTIHIVSENQASAFELPHNS